MNDVTQDLSSQLSVDIADAVRSTALLANLSVSTWSGERTDRTLMDEIKSNKGAVGNAGRAVKNLMCGVDEHIRKVQAAYKNARYAHYDLTLPWITNPKAALQGGPRLLPTALFEKYLTTMSEIRNNASTTLDAFLAEYPNLVQQAMTNLGGMAQMSDYPDVDEVKTLFRLAFDFEPIPSGASFQGLSPNTTLKLSRMLEAKQARASEAAQAAMWTQVRDRVAHLADRLTDPDTRFKGATVEDVRALVDILPGWNVTGSPHVGPIVMKLSRMMDGVDANKLRKDDRLRLVVLNQCKDILNEMSLLGV